MRTSTSHTPFDPLYNPMSDFHHLTVLAVKYAPQQSDEQCVLCDSLPEIQTPLFEPQTLFVGRGAAWHGLDDVQAVRAASTHLLASWRGGRGRELSRNFNGGDSRRRWWRQSSGYSSASSTSTSCTSTPSCGCNHLNHPNSPIWRRSGKYLKHPF